MSRAKSLIEMGALIESDGFIGRIKQIFDRPTYLVEKLEGGEVFVAAADAKRVSAEEEIRIWKMRAEASELQPKTVTITLERDGVINGIMCPAGQYKITEYPNAPSIVTRLQTIDPPEKPMVHIPAEDDEPYKAVCSQCGKTEDFPDEADAATDMQKKGWKFMGGEVVCSGCGA